MKHSLEQIQKFQKRKKQLLIIAIVADVIGLLSYAFPGIFELIDFVWAPLAALTNMLMFGGWVGILGGLGTFVEEILPMTDFIPSFTIMWFIKFYVLEKKTRKELAETTEEKAHIIED